MMKLKLIIGNQDASELIESIAWSGDTKQVARKLSFTLAQKATDKHIPRIVGDAGTLVEFGVDNNILFRGIVQNISRSTSGNTVSYSATDYMWYLMESDISRVFDSTPEVITSQICADLGIPFGGAAATGIKVYVPILGKKAYEGIMMAYTYASRQNGKKYIPLMNKSNQVTVIQKGLESGVLLDGEYNLIDAAYSNSIERMVNKVLITDKSGVVIKSIVDSASTKQFGTIQRVIKQEDGKDATAQAKALLKTFEQSASAAGLSNTGAVSGYSLLIREPYTGLVGRFYIESDTHTFSNGKAEMQLTLAFDNLMDEKEIEKTEDK